MLIRVVLYTFFLIYFPIVSAAPFIFGGPNDYYDPNPTVRARRVLSSVEKLHLKHAIELIKKGQIQDACDNLDFTLRWFPNHPRALLILSDLLRHHKCPQEGMTAVKYFDAAIKYFPRDANTRILYGIYFHRHKMYDKALKQYEIALKLKPDSAELHYNLGLLYLAMNDIAKAEKSAREAYRLGYPLPGLKNKLIKLGVWNKKTEKPKEGS